MLAQRRESEQKLENLFDEILDKINFERDQLVLLVTTAKYEVFVKEYLREQQRDHGGNSGGFSEV